MLNKIFGLLFSILMICGLSACHEKNHSVHKIRVGTIAGPETQLVEVAKQVALQKYRLEIEIVEFNDYNTPNLALNDGSIDANMIQHQPYLSAMVSTHGYTLVSAGKVFIYPMAIYSKKCKTLAELPDQAIVAVPNDPSNETRALLLLQQANLIKLTDPKSISATIHDIRDNPKKLVIKELDAAQLPRVLPDVDLAVINTNYALVAGLQPRQDGLVVENHFSPYANIVAVKADRAHDKNIEQLMSSLHSNEVIKEARKLFGENAIPAW